MFALLKRKKEKHAAAEALYRAIMAQSREPVFYELYSVPDTIDGRFDLVCLHAFLVMDRLYEEGRAGEKLAQALFDRMFRDMDSTLREMGVGDLSVPKHMKRMMKGFNGRAMTYQEVMQSGEPEDLYEVLQRNLYGGSEEIGADILHIMALYMFETALQLETQPWESLSTGIIEFKAIDYEPEEDIRKHPAGMVA